MSDPTTVPSDPKERAKLKSMLAEMTKYLAESDKQKEYMKETATAIFGEFGIPKKTINQLARIMYKRNYADWQAENEDFEFLYEALILGSKDETKAA